MIALLSARETTLIEYYTKTSKNSPTKTWNKNSDQPSRSLIERKR